MHAAEGREDRLIGEWSRRLAEQLVGFAGIRSGDTVLDVGAGAGTLSEALAAVSGAGQIVGVDPAPARVALANARQIAPHVRFEVGHPEQLWFLDDTFDHALSCLSVDTTMDIVGVLGEMIRVTRPGGTIAAAVSDFEGGIEMLRVFWEEARALHPAAATVEDGQARWRGAVDLANQFAAVGLRDVRGALLTVETSFASFEDYWIAFLDWHEPAGAYFATLQSAMGDELRTRLRQRLLGSEPDGPLLLQARGFAVRAVVPPAVRASAAR